MAITIESLVFKQIKLLIGKSMLSKKEQDEFISILTHVSNDELEQVATLFVESSSWIEIMYHNYKDKQEALEQKDVDKWKGIVSQEESILGTL